MRAIVTAIALCCACMFSLRGTGATDALPAADDIVARAKAAAGAEPQNYRESITSTGARGDTTQVTYHAGNDVRTTFDRGGFHSESGTFRGESWRQNNNGLTFLATADPGNEVDEHISTTVSHVTTPSDAFVIARLNDRKAGTRTYYDATSYRIVRSETTGANGTVVNYSDFVRFGTRVLPQHWTVSSAAGKSEQQFTRTEYAEGVTTPADVAETPTQRTLVDFPAAVKSVRLPSSFINNAVFIRLTVGKRAVDFELDTGASGIVMDPALASDLGLQLTNATTAINADRYTSYDARVPEIDIGDLTMHDIAVHVAPMPAGHPFGAKPLGLLGFDFLAQLGVTIDYQNEAVEVTRASDFRLPADPQTVVLPIRLNDAIPTLSARIDARIADHIALDTGWSGELGFFDYFARRYPDVFHNAVGVAMGYGVGGQFSAGVYRFSLVDLGPLRFTDFLGLRIGPSSYSLASIDGVIGADMLSMFKVRLDYTDGHVYLSRNLAKAPAHPAAGQKTDHAR